MIEGSTKIMRYSDKTIVPIHLVKRSELASRSEAREILSGLELFKEVILDFHDIEDIGQAFADEIFRVFPKMNPATSITAKNANPNVQYWINRVINIFF